MADAPSNYDDAPDSAPAEEPTDEGMDATPHGLLQRDFFGHKCKVGDTYTVRVEAIHGDEVEVSPVSDKEEGEEDGEMAEAPAPSESGDSEMASMME